MSQKRQHKLKANWHLKSNHRWFVSSRQLASCFCLYFHCSVCCCFVIIYLETPLAYLNYKKVKFVVCWCWCAPVQKSCTAQKQRKENKNTPKKYCEENFPFILCVFWDERRLNFLWIRSIHLIGISLETYYENYSIVLRFAFFFLFQFRFTVHSIFVVVIPVRCPNWKYECNSTHCRRWRWCDE